MIKGGLKSEIFKIDQVPMGGTTEYIVRGGRDKFSRLPFAFGDIKQIGIIGWGSQAPAQAKNLRDTLETIGSQIRIKVGLRENSSHIPDAQAAGFTAETNTLGEMFQVIRESDLVLLLISDAAQAANHERIFDAMTPGSILGLSHGFLKGYLDSIGSDFPEHISVIGVCPKGMGPSVRRLYEQGKEVNGAGINCSIAIEQNRSGISVSDVAIGWAIGIGAPYIFGTTLKQEYLSDLVGERSVLLAAEWGILEAYWRDLVIYGIEREQAFRSTAENITGVISPLVSKKGIIGVYDSLRDGALSRADFERAFSAAYWPFRALVEEIYQEVASGNEIKSVLMAGERMDRFPMEEIGNTPMWVTGRKVRAERGKHPLELNPYMAGLYCAAMMAQIDVLRGKGHPVSEICNESVIEATDSLTPYTHSRGIDYMVDGCSMTARIGTRKYGPRWDYATQRALISSTTGGVDTDLIQAFLQDPIHDALAVCATMRPPVDISVQ